MKCPEIIILGLDGAMPSYIKEAVAQGELPNFARLIKKGVLFNDFMPVFPSVTPTCWTAISTGAVPSVTGALGAAVHKDGTHPTKFITPYNSTNIRAERFWEAAAKAGKKSLIYNIPSSGPAKVDGVMQIMGGVIVTPDDEPANTYCSGIPQQFFKNDPSSKELVDSVKIAGSKSELINGSSAYEDLGNGKYRFFPVYTNKHYIPGEVEKHSWIIIAENEGVRIGVDESDAENAQILKVGEWSDVITRRLMTDYGERVPFHFRARLDEYDTETKTFKVYVSGAIDLCKEITPLSLAKEIAEIPEIRCLDYTYLAAKPKCIKKFFEGVRFAVNWSKKLLSHCIEKHTPDIVFTYFGTIDCINHYFRGIYEKARITSDDEYETAVKATKLVYEFADEELGFLLDNYVGENTTIAVVSDHGAIGEGEEFNAWEVMEKAGLMHFYPNDQRRLWNNPHIDWSKTKAYPTMPSYINVNLKGREPCGIVDENDYDETVTEIIRALYKYGFSDDGKTPVIAFAVHKDQAGFIGHGGPDCADVVYGLAGSRVGGVSEVHEEQIPSARSKTGDIRSLCIISGPKFKENAELNRPTDLTDFAPTLCYALNYPQPKDATGGVVFQAFRQE